MKRISCLILILPLLLVCLVSCTGYNQIMRDHLADADNYHTYEVILEDLYYFDFSTKEKKRDITDQTFLDNDITFEVSFLNSYDEVRPFLGGEPNEDIPLDKYIFHFEVTKNNSRILLSNDFYKHIKVGEKIRIKVSDFIYMDGYFFYIAQLEYNGRVYLRLEDGLKNIVDMMEENKSIF